MHSVSVNITCWNALSFVCMYYYVMYHSQGFMQNNIIASHTCFGGHMGVDC